MKITFGEEGLEKTQQAPFPATVKCCHCRSESRIAFVAHEGIDEDDKNSERLCALHNFNRDSEEDGLWLHDCCSVAVYFCEKCLEPTAKYNQG